MFYIQIMCNFIQTKKCCVSMKISIVFLCTSRGKQRIDSLIYIWRPLLKRYLKFVIFEWFLKFDFFNECFDTLKPVFDKHAREVREIGNFTKLSWIWKTLSGFSENFEDFSRFFKVYKLPATPKKDSKLLIVYSYKHNHNNFGVK